MESINQKVYRIGMRVILSIKDVVWLVYLYPLKWVVRVMPCRLVLTLGRRLAPLLLPLTRGHRRRIEERARAVADKLPPECPPEWIAREFVRKAAVRALEDLLITRLIRKGLDRVRISGREHLDKALADGTGVMVVGAHCFANRLAKRYLASQGYDILSVRNRNQKDPAAGRLGRRWLKPRYIAFLGQAIGEEVHPRDRDCGLRILAKLREGGLVHIYLDGAFSREVRKLEFLGKRVKFPVGFLDIVRLTRVPVLPMMCIGDSRDLGICFLPPAELAEAPDREAFIEANVPLLASRLESIILSHPDEWELWVKM